MTSRPLRLATLLLVFAALLAPASPAAALTSILSIQDAAVVEGNGGTTNIVLTLSVIEISNLTVGGLVSTSSGGTTLNATGGASCASAGVDFIAVGSQPFSIPANTASTTVTLSVCGDTTDEADERFAVLLTNVSNAQCLEGTCDAIVTIRDNEPLASISGPISVNETNTGTTAATFTVSLSAAAGSGLSVPFSTANGTATGGGACNSAGVDYITSTGLLSFNTGDVSQTVTISVCGDTRDEPTQTFFVNLSDGNGYELGATTQGQANIVDNDSPPFLTIGNASAPEGQPCGTQLCVSFSVVTFTAGLSAASDRTVTVDFATSSGTAAGGNASICSPGPTDFRGRTGALTFAPGETSKSIGIQVCKDAVVEANENFLVTLSNPVNATCTGGDCSAVGLIVNDDSNTGTFAVNPENATVDTDEHVLYTLLWTVPSSQVWRDLRTIDFKLADDGHTAVWVRWDEPANTLALCQSDSGKATDATCDSGHAPGSSRVLQTSRARLHLAESSVQGSGPEGRDVTLRLGLSFKGGAEGQTYQAQVAAADDIGNHDETFLPAGSVQVIR